MEKPTTKNVVTTLLKLAFCGATIAMVAWAIVIVDGSGDVKETSADLLSLSPVPMTNTARFEEALDGLNHSEPRVFDHNGNEIGFSSRTTRKRPTRLLADYQRAFVEAGINERTYLGRPGADVDPDKPVDDRLRAADQEALVRQEAMMSGQVIPLDIDKERVSMGSVLVEGKPQTRRALREQFKETGPKNLGELYDGYRYIVAERDEESGVTSVTAAWSRGEFDMERNRPKTGREARKLDEQTGIPTCVGCSRVTDFSGQANAVDDHVAIFGSRRDPGQLTHFYDQAMRQRGWKRTSTNRMLDSVLDYAEQAPDRLRLRQYERNGEMTTIGIRQSPGLDKSTITTYQSK
jgi:hypothetical protein